LPPGSEAGAQCGNTARWDLCGGPPARAVPTATGAFYRSELRFLAWRINDHLVRWAMKKFKRFRGRYARAFDWLVRVHQFQPALFAHWRLAPPLRGRPVGAG